MKHFLVISVIYGRNIGIHSRRINKLKLNCYQLKLIFMWIPSHQTLFVSLELTFSWISENFNLIPNLPNCKSKHYRTVNLTTCKLFYFYEISVGDSANRREYRSGSISKLLIFVVGRLINTCHKMSLATSGDKITKPVYILTSRQDFEDGHLPLTIHFQDLDVSNSSDVSSKLRSIQYSDNVESWIFIGSEIMNRRKRRKIDYG